MVLGHKEDGQSGCSRKSTASLLINPRNHQPASSTGISLFFTVNSMIGSLTLYRNLFPEPGPKSNTEKLDIKIDKTMGNRRPAGNNQNPNDNAFGFFIMSGPENEITSVNKRDGSHWKLFDCDNTAGEERQTIKAVCTDTSESSNCNLIFKGGLESTIVEMPHDCGPGKYAIAWKMVPSNNHDHIRHRLEKRGLTSAPVYDFTFDYDFTSFEKRADPSNVLLCIDYSDDPGYWSSIIAAAPGSKAKRKRDFELETLSDGDHKAWLEQAWHKEKRGLHYTELHKRWWSDNVRVWWDRQRNVDIKYEGVSHRVQVSKVSLGLCDTQAHGTAGRV